MLGSSKHLQNVFSEARVCAIVAYCYHHCFTYLLSMLVGITITGWFWWRIQNRWKKISHLTYADIIIILIILFNMMMMKMTMTMLSCCQQA